MDLGSHFNFVVYIILMMMGMLAMIGKRNLIKKVIGMAIFQAAIILFFISLSAKTGGDIPILHGSHGHLEAPDPDRMVNPLPHVLMLTAIVVGVSTLGVALAIAQRIFKDYGSLEENEILERTDG